MGYPLLELPQIPGWAQQLANILPFTVLIEFIDVSMKLHVFELTAQVPLWNWPVTPKGARLLLSREPDLSGVCCLDQADMCGVVLQCIDGRYGDCYPSSAPNTARLCVAALPVDHTIPNDSASPCDRNIRLQTLDILHVRREQQSKQRRNPSRTRNALIGSYSLRYRLISSIGWFLWLSSLIINFISGLYVAAAYLILLALTGVVVSISWGGWPCHLRNEHHSPHSRLIIAADSMNASRWLAFYGDSSTLNGLLCRTFYRKQNLVVPRKPLRWTLSLLVVGQWILALISCTLQNWDALMISAWCIFCALTSEWAYSPSHSARDWIRYTCNISIRRVQTHFSSRRAMLGALVAVNPDTKERRLQWINPILEDGPERREWQRALLESIETGVCPISVPEDSIYRKWIQEGVTIGQQIVGSLRGSDVPEKDEASRA
ncbi:hypothetical protein AN3553.2 [Paecilomyces variotii No. 5]|uniref:Uncharacterized protein n=1 Tax=Byssochlamys spectabilis (strain No. 5 / NBRC 109023) TaxID=1356009 RepID=V5FV46_BYSSN|nr:hypothetical protein AN3553.2 [Paecilomyces variotii No. 5]